MAEFDKDHVAELLKAAPKEQVESSPVVDSGYVPSPPVDGETLVGEEWVPEKDLRATLLASSSENPDQFAETLGLSKKTGVPTDVIKERMDEFKSTGEFTPEFVKTLRSENGSLYDWLQKPENAKVAHDDVSSLAEFGKSVMNVPNALMKGQTNLMIGQLRYKQMKGNATSEELAYIEEYHKQNKVRDARDPKAKGTFANIPSVVAETIPNLLEVTKQSLVGGIAFGVPSGGLATPVGLSAGALKASAEIEAGLAYDEFLSIRGENGETLDPQTARTAAFVVGLGNGALETLSLGKIAKTVPGISNLKRYLTRDGVKQLLKTKPGRDALGKVAKTYGESIATETATEAMQEAMTMYAGELQKITQDGSFQVTPFEDQVSRIGEAGKAGFQAAVGLGFPGTAINTGRAIAESKNTPDPSSVAQYLRDTASKVQNSKLYQRSPDKFREQAEAQTKGEDFYINSEKGIELYQSLPPEIQEQLNEAMPELYNELREGSVTGKDIPVSQADYFTYLAPNDEQSVLSDYTKLNAEEYSIGEINEVHEANEQIREVLDELREEYASDQMDYQKVLNNSEQLEQRLVSELQNSGKRFTQSAYRAMASAHKNLYETQIERYGPSAQIALEKLYGKFHIEGPAQDAKATQRRTLEDGYLDSIRNEAIKRRKKDEKSQAKSEKSMDMLGGTKAKKEKATPTPLISLIASMGGIMRGTPIAKELSAIGITPKSYSRLFRSDGSVRGLDNLVIKEVEDSLGISGVFPDNGTGYIDQGQLLELLRDETFGKYLRNEDQKLADTLTDQMDQTLNELSKQGLDVESITNQEIRDALKFATEAAQKIVVEEPEMYWQGEIKTDSDAFKNWFGDSKVVGEDGKPLVVYHGTPSKDISEFAFDYSRIGDQGRMEGAGFYFTDSEGIASGYGEDGTVIDAYMSIQKPIPYEQEAFDVDTTKKIIKEMAEQEAIKDEMDIEDGFLSNYGDARYDGLDSVISTAAEMSADSQSALDQLSDFVSQQVSIEVVNRAVQKVTGYDGFIANGFGNENNRGGTIYVAFFPEQIKSVNNQGAFDPNDARILYQSTNESAQGLQSALLKTSKELKQNKGSGDQFLAMIRKTAGIKEDEIAWTGLDEFLKGKKSITKDEIVSFLEENQVKLEEVTLGGESGVIEEVSEAQSILDDGGDIYAIDSSGRVASITTDDNKILPYVSDNWDNYTVKKGSYEKTDQETKYSNYTLNGGENYREILMTLPNKDGLKISGYIIPTNDTDVDDILTSISSEGLESLDYGRTENVDGVEIIQFDNISSTNMYRIKRIADGYGETFTESERTGSDDTYSNNHFDQSNILAHVRLNDRTDADGNKVLFVEEIQSDWHQAGRKKGYIIPELKEQKNSLNDRITQIEDRLHIVRSYLWEMRDESEKNSTKSKLIKEQKELNLEKTSALKELEVVASSGGGKVGSVPDAPMKKNWHEMAFRRVAQMASQNGYDSVAWTTGEMQNDRFDLSKSVSSVVYRPETKRLRAYDLDDKSVIDQEVEPNDLDNYVGKDVADRLLKTELDAFGEHQLEDSGLKVGGDGMKGFYDKMIPSYAKKFGKKFDAKVGVAKINDKKDVISFDQYKTQEGFLPDENPKWLREKYDRENKANTDVWNLPITDNMRESANKGFELFQDGDGDKRGSIRFSDKGDTILKLTEASDLSTFLHESGHLWLEYWRDFSAQDDAPTEAKQDWQAIRDWLGLKDGQEIETEHHEKFARGTETYFMTGKAPSKNLDSAFRQFSSWLIKLYKDIRNLDADLSPEITEVFDRMFATSEQINDVVDADNFTADPQILELLTKAEKEKYLKLSRENMETAKERLLRDSLKQHTRKETKWYKEERERVVNQVTADLKEDDTYKALNFVLNGTDFDGNELNPNGPHKMSKKKFIDLYGAENAKAMPKGSLINDKNGVHPEIIAEMFGFSDGGLMAESMMNAVPFKEKVSQEADGIMIERHGDMLNDGSIEEKARDAINDDLRASTIGYELEQLSLKSGEPVITKEQIKTLAKEILFERPLGKIRPYDYYRSELKNARLVGRHLARQDYDKASEAKRKQLLNHYLFREAREAQKDVEKTVKKWGIYNDSDKKWGKRKSINIDYVYAIRSILGGYGIGNPGKFDFDNWYQQLQLENPEASETLAGLVELNTAEAKNYKEMNYESFLGLKNAIQGLSDIGRDILDIEIQGKKLKTQELVSKIKDHIADNNNQRDHSKHYEDIGDKTKIFLGQYDKEVTRMEFILKAMDGGETNGLLNQVFINPLAKAGRDNFERNRDFADKFKDIMHKNDGIKGRWNDKVTDVRFGNGKFTVKNIITIALNMGNEGNIQKLLDGYEWSYADVRGLVERYLTKQDMDTVQEIWDLMEVLRPDIQRVHKDVTGFPMEVVKRQPLETKWGTYTGGYFPVVYNTRKSVIGQRNSESVNVFESNFTIPTVGKGMTKSRSNFSAPIDLNFDDVASNHFRKTIQLITHGKIVKDLSRIVQQKDFQESMIEYSGADTYSQFKPWLQAVAGDTVYDTPIAGIEKIVRHLRTATTGIFMGFGVSTMLKQTLGMTTTMAAVTRGELSKKNFLKGTKQFSTHPSESVKFAMDNSFEMVSRVSYLNADVAQVIQSANKLQDWRGKIQYAGMAGIGYAQLYSVDVPTWMAGYEEGMEQFNDRDRAIEFADALVRQTQGSGHIKDLARVQRGGEFQKASVAMFGTFILGVLYPRLRELGLDARDGSAAKASLSLIPLIILPAILESMMSGDAPEDDENYALWAINKSMLYGSSSLPIASNLVSAAFGDYDYAMSPTESPINMFIHKIKSDDPEKWMEGLAVGTGLAFKLPTYKPYKILDEMTDQLSGDEDFNPLELLGAIPDSDRR